MPGEIKALRPQERQEERMQFTDKVCIVTGGGSGIGRSTCERFAAEGGKVLVVDVNAAHGNETVQAVTAAGGQALFAAADIGNPEQVKAAVDLAVQHWGKIDILVNNAAMMTFQPIVDLPVEDWDQVLAVNLRSVFLFCKYCLPHMQGGAIVNISSVSGLVGWPSLGIYSASKFALEGASETMAPGTRSST